MMKTNEVAKRYAKAVLAATKESKNHHEILIELEALSQAIKNDEIIQSFLLNPTVSSKEKGQKIVDCLTGTKSSAEIKNLIELLASKNRLYCLADIASALHKQIDLDDGLTRGTVKSARPLSLETKQKLEDKIKTIIKKKITLTYHEDATLIGGLIAQVGGWIFDDSIDSHLKRMSEELNRRTS